MILKRLSRTLIAIMALGAATWVAGQTPVPAPSNEPSDNDPILREAETMVGKSLFLRGFYSGNELKYTASGKITGSHPPEAWTLAGVNILKVTRKSAAELELDGVRVAILYNPDAHEFQRHPLNDQKIEVMIDAPTNASMMESAFAAMFSYGIDPALQRSMPDYWRHYFDPSLAWPSDSLNGQTVYPLYGPTDQPKDVTPPKPTQAPAAPRFTPFAEHDRVQGSVIMRVALDAEGTPKRIWLAMPLGYGLDEQAVEAVARWKFTPAMRNGSAVPAAVYVEQKFVPPPPPQH